MNYPSGEIVLDFHTDETGSFMLNEPLVYGDYLLYEKQAPWSYQVSMEPYPFTVEKSSVHQPNIYLNLTIKQADDVQKGRIVVEKIGNLLTGAETYTTLLGMTAMRPVWELMPLGEGAEFELYAREDIITPDGVDVYKRQFWGRSALLTCLPSAAATWLTAWFRKMGWTAPMRKFDPKF